MKRIILFILCYLISISNYAFTREETLRLHQNSLLTAPIVMLGDSITAMAPWNDLLSDKNIANRGISADTTDAVFSRLSTLPKIKANRVFIMIGINDFRLGLNVNQVFNNYVQIIDYLQKMSLKVIIQSTLRCNIDYPICKNSNYKVNELNKRLELYAKSIGIGYIDLNTTLASTPKGLNKIYTNDGLHLNMLGYEKWANIINGYIKN